MSLSDRERFIMHMTTVMTLATMGDPIDVKKIQDEIRKGRCRRLTDEEVYNVWEDLKEEVLNGRAVYEEMVAKLSKDNDLFKAFGDKGI